MKFFVKILFCIIIVSFFGAIFSKLFVMTKNKKNVENIEIEKKDEIGYFRNDIRNIYFDEDGNVTNVSIERKTDITEISGVDIIARSVGENVKNNRDKCIEIFIDIIKILRKNNIRPLLIYLAPSNEIHLYIDELDIEFGGTVNIDYKVQKFIDIYKKIKGLKGILNLKNAKPNDGNEQYIFKKIN